MSANQQPESFRDVVRAAKGELEVNSDDLREVLLLFMTKLKTVDIAYCLATIETEYGRRKYGHGYGLTQITDEAA